MNQPWKIEMLGGLRVCQEATVITRFKTHKTGALLAYLALYSQRAHTREALIELLWPESDLSQGRPSLSVALSSLRHQLEPPGVPSGSVLITTNTEVRLNPEATITDVAEFEALLKSAEQAATSAEEVALLTRATELYCGELLPGHYEDWCFLERERLQSLYIQALRRLVRGLVKERALPQALTYAEKAVTIDPLQEELHRDLMQLYVAAGQPSLALRQYRAMEERWQEELGERPSAAIRRLAEEITARMQETPETAPKSAAPAPKPPAASVPKERSVVSPGGIQTYLLAAISASGKRAPLSEEVLEGLRKQAQTHGGQETAGQKGTLLLAFGRAADAQACAVAVRRAFAEASESAELGLALHTGEADDEARLRALKGHLDALWGAAHPGQILCSEETALFLRNGREPGFRLRDLGRWRLTDSEEAIPLFEITDRGEAETDFPPPRAEPAHTPELPMQFTRFFGREAELERIAALLTSEPKARLVTLTGPGGTGKTRLAIEAARQMADAWRGAVWFVSLAQAREADQIMDTILKALHLPLSGTTRPLALLQESLGRQPSLLVLDNLEQVAEEAGEVVRQLLEAISDLSCLATSRQRLNIAAEQEFAVPTLPTPAGETTLDALSRCESVRLFVDRAQAVKLDFQITEHNAAALAELCDRLEGLPLALELAASRAQALTPAQMLTQLEDRFTFLATRRRDLPERHRMLRATIDWSYQLLDAPMQQFFASLSIFRGGWTLQAAADICKETLALDALCQLQECSLVVTDESADGSELRFRMLQTLRAFGEEQLTLEDQEKLQARHADYFADFARSAAEHLSDARQAEWLHRLDAEHENLRAALETFFDTGRVTEAARLCAFLSEYWERHGWLREAVSFLNRCLTAQPPLADSSLRRRLLSSAGWFAYLQGRYTEAQEWQEQNLAECKAAQDVEGECIAWNNLGLIAQVQGRLEDAWRAFEQSLEMARRLNDTERKAARLSNLGLLAIQQNRMTEARTYLEEALAIFRAGENRYGVAACLCNIAKLALYQEAYTEAEALAEESLKLFEEAGDRSGIAYALANLGLAKTLQNQQASAAEDLRRALALCQETGLYSLTPVLLETWARNEREETFLAAAFALAAAERLRAELQMPRNAFEEQTIEDVVRALTSRSEESDVQRERALTQSLPLDQLIARALEIDSGEVK